VDTFQYLPEPVMYTAWIMWILAITINTMIFLNFLIAVISDVYCEVQQN
jgi:hypothetical protein